MRLNELKTGQSARIVEVGGEGSLRNRLIDMGLIPGTLLTLRKVAPMGDPIEILIRGYELTLRLEHAADISVELIPQEPPVATESVPENLPKQPDKSRIATFFAKFKPKKKTEDKK